MSKSILILSASPRRSGNSDLLADQFLKGAIEANHKVEKIFLGDRDISFCLGCEYCQKNSGACVRKDDMGEILDKMAGADVIVMATPVYFYTMNAQMKTLIDRTVARYTEISGKEFYYILTAAEPDRKAMERTIEGFRGFTDCLNGAKEAGIIYGTGVWEKGAVQTRPEMQTAFEMGKKV